MTMMCVMGSAWQNTMLQQLCVHFSPEMEATKEKVYAGESKRSIGISVINSHKEKLSFHQSAVGLLSLMEDYPHHSLEAQGLSWMALLFPTPCPIWQKMGYSQTPGSENHVPHQLNFVLLEEASVWLLDNLSSNNNSTSYNLGDLEYTPYPL